MNLIGINETIPAVAWPTDEDLKAVIAKTHSLGGIVLMNHLTWSQDAEGDFSIPRMQNHPTLAQLKSWGVDALDILSPNGYDPQTYQFAVENKMMPLSGTDIHKKSDHATCWTHLSVPGHSTKALKSIATSLGHVGKEDILKALRDRNTDPAFSMTVRNPLHWDVAVDPSTNTNPNSILTWMPWFPFGDIIVESLVDRAGGMSSFTGETCHNASSIGRIDTTSGWLDERKGHGRSWKWQWISSFMWLVGITLMMLWMALFDWAFHQTAFVVNSFRRKKVQSSNV